MVDRCSGPYFVGTASIKQTEKYLGVCFTKTKSLMLCGRAPGDIINFNFRVPAHKIQHNFAAFLNNILVTCSVILLHSSLSITRNRAKTRIVALVFASVVAKRSINGHGGRGKKKTELLLWWICRLGSRKQQHYAIASLSQYSRNQRHDDQNNNGDGSHYNIH